jgi:serine/threonine protein kinase
LVAQGVLELRELLDGPRTSEEDLPWAPIPAHRSRGYREAAELLRTSLPTTDAHILELHHVRELSISDVAYVSGCTVEAATAKLKAAEAYALILVEERMGADELPALDTILLDAFRLDSLPAKALDAPTDTPPALAPGTVIAGRYELEQHIAAGAFGHVYRARDVLVPGHLVAMKLLHRRAPSQAGRSGAIRELSLTASVFHPSVVQFKDHGWYDDRLWFVMPWYHGETLHERIARAPLTAEEAFPIFEQLARALAALHATGIRHQDVKPDNIMLVDLDAGRSGDTASNVLPVLLDLGGAAPQGDMALVGTPIYFAPEVAERFVRKDSDVPLTDRADVFALALTLLHAVAPSSMNDQAAMEFEAFLEHRAEAAPPIPPLRSLRHLRSRIVRWLAVDARTRPTAAELADELAVLAGHAPRQRSRDGASRSVSLRSALAGGLAVAIGFGAAAWLTPSSSAGELETAERRADLTDRDLANASERARLLERELTVARQALEAVSAPTETETAPTETAPTETETEIADVNQASER